MKKQEYFDPRTNKFPYPIDTDKHYLVVKKNDGTVFDENIHILIIRKNLGQRMGILGCSTAEMKMSLAF